MPNVWERLNIAAEAERAARESAIRENAQNNPGISQPQSPPQVYNAWNPNPRNPTGTLYPTSGSAYLQNRDRIIALLPDYVKWQQQWNAYMEQENRRKIAAANAGKPYIPVPPNRALEQGYYNTRNQLRELGFLSPDFQINKHAVSDNAIGQAWTAATTPKPPAAPVTVPQDSLARLQRGNEALGLTPAAGKTQSQYGKQTNNGMVGVQRSSTAPASGTEPSNDLTNLSVSDGVTRETSTAGGVKEMQRSSTEIAADAGASTGTKNKPTDPVKSVSDMGTGYRQGGNSVMGDSPMKNFSWSEPN